jgi:hypothetical protein
MDTLPLWMVWQQERFGRRKRAPGECLEGRKEVMRMLMNATIMSVKMNDFYGVEANIFDADEEQTYKAEIVGGLPGLSELLELKKIALKKGGVSDVDLAALAALVPMPPKMQLLALRVRRVKVNKAGFMTLVCDLSV